jgi:hypothetical protein
MTRTGKADTGLAMEFVRWIDSASITEGWVQVGEVDLNFELECQTVGFVMDEKKDRITLCLNVGLDDNRVATTVDGTITIPKVAIISRQRLEVRG